MKRNNDLNFVFFGTPDFSIEVLHVLAEQGLLPKLVVTSPDQKSGRKLQLTPSPVKKWAEKNNIPMFQPIKLDDEAYKKLSAQSWDFFLVAAYTKLIPERFLNIPKYQTLNVHPSLLPRLRGPSPIRSAILNEHTTGTTVIVLDKEMDHGPILMQRERIAREWPIRGTILDYELFRIGGELLLEILPQWISGSLIPTAQDESKATYCKKIKKEDGLIDINDKGDINYRKFLAYDGWPRVFFFQNNKRIIITDAVLEDGTFVIKRVLPEGRKEISYQEFKNQKKVNT